MKHLLRPYANIDRPAAVAFSECLDHPEWFEATGFRTDITPEQEAQFVFLGGIGIRLAPQEKSGLGPPLQIASFLMNPKGRPEVIDAFTLEYEKHEALFRGHLRPGLTRFMETYRQPLLSRTVTTLRKRNHKLVASMVFQEVGEGSGDFMSYFYISRALIDKSRAVLSDVEIDQSRRAPSRFLPRRHRKQAPIAPEIQVAQHLLSPFLITSSQLKNQLTRVGHQRSIIRQALAQAPQNRPLN